MLTRSLLFWLLFCGVAQAEQPIFGEMPRWDGGYGLQVIQLFRHQEVRHADHDTTVERATHFTRIDGVYTWDKAIRLTGKLRIIDFASQDNQSNAEWQGLSALTLALPLKQYFNLDGRSGSLTFAPQIFIPFKGNDAGADYPFNQVGRAGASFGYETESYHYHFGVSVSAWMVYSEKVPMYVAEIGTGLNGFTYGFNGHLKVGLAAQRLSSGRINVHVGPTVYGMLSDEWHWQLKTRHAVPDWQYRSMSKSDHIVGLGLGWVQ